ncbi:flippase [Candidatus Parcubacteria bacterium]|nr:flippase [Candidatus Parcubacteria bacterium]
MSTKVANIAKNTSYYTFALIFQKIISFTYFTLIARALGPENLGKYYFAISFTTIFAIFIDLGLANVLIREVAKAKDKAQDFLSSVLLIKIPLAIFSLLAVVILINLMGYSELTKYLVYLSAICMILDSFTLTFFSTIRGFHNLFFESIAAIIFQLVVLSFGLTVLHFGMGLRWLMGALVAASVFNFIYSASLIKFRWKIKLRPVIDSRLIKTIIKITIPFALFGVFQKLYMYLDTVLLSVLAGDKYVGLYQIAFKIIFALQFLPMAFMASLYPAFAAYWIKNKEQLATTFERAINYLIIISLPIAIGVIVLADKIILIFKSGFSGAILPLQITMAALLFIFLNFPIGSLLNACDRQKINTRNMGIALLASVAMNIILIPKFQAVGASITVVITNLLMFLLGMIWVPKIIKIRPMKIISTFLKVVAATAIMGVAAFYLKSLLNVFIVVAICGAIYFVLLFLLGGFKKEDVLSIYNSFIKKSNQ